MLRFTQVSHILSAIKLKFTFEQAGLLLDTKKFVEYVWEEKPVILTLPYFSLGGVQSYVCPIHIKIIFSIFLSWCWNWIIKFFVNLRTLVPSSLGKKLESLTSQVILLQFLYYLMLNMCYCCMYLLSFGLLFF